MTTPHLDCQRCGACCAVFRVSFYWAEADDTLGGTVPVALTRPVGPLHRCMAGTEARPVRCVALQGEVGRSVACGIYELRSSTCRSVQPGDEQCLKARAAHGLEGGAGRGPDRLRPGFVQATQEDAVQPGQHLDPVD